MLCLLDNLEAQKHFLFQQAMEKYTTRLFFYAPGETDVLAPVDAGYGKDIKFGVGQQMHKWLDIAANLELW